MYCPFNQVLLGGECAGEERREGEGSLALHGEAEHDEAFFPSLKIQPCSSLQGGRRAGVQLVLGDGGEYARPEASENVAFGGLAEAPIDFVILAWKLAISSGPLGLLSSHLRSADLSSWVWRLTSSWQQGEGSRAG